ncbi:hypothetical protein E1218_24730 [Kribbella turkmenica]|uniref:Peptidase S33 tripeptidyl aminopeptidase-like C-terminal domain-containing protein n=1 Tax=Kribbella turkmenica TaxID=2530375 RepID=A0A4R4WKQ1_9ACTN|nr:hypothetical protein E1218_24730 [Kribbella turkmenica]
MEASTKTPVMVIGTRYDRRRGTRPPARTPISARTRTWSRSRVTVHTVLGKSTCADNLITAYLTTLTAPADGATCTQDRQPFGPVPANPKLFQGPGLQSVASTSSAMAMVSST